jgi:hypothetical protein
MLVVAALAAVAYVQAHQTNNRGARIPAGFAELDDAFWKGPWIYSSGTRRAAITGLHHRMGAASGAAMPIRLDDGSTGRLRVTTGPCTTLDECGPGECACSATDSFWIDVTDSRGRRAAQVHLSAAYGEFDVIPVDLVDGPGDELVIIRLHQRAAPPPGPDLQIWKVGATQPVDLIQRKGHDDLFFLGGRLQTVEGAIPCAEWRTRLSVNLDAPKPRSIARRAEFAASDWPDAGCHLSGEGAREMAAVKRHRLLAFEKGAYRLR